MEYINPRKGLIKISNELICVVHQEEVERLLIETYVNHYDQKYAKVTIAIKRKKLHFWIEVNRPKYDPEVMEALKAKWKEEARQRNLKYKENLKKGKELAKTKTKK